MIVRLQWTLQMNAVTASVSPAWSELVIKAPTKSHAAAFAGAAAAKSIVFLKNVQPFPLLDKRNHQANHPPLQTSKSEQVKKMTWQWPFRICWKQKYHTRGLSYLSWAFLHLKKKEEKKDKSFICSKVYKEQLTSCIKKANDLYNFRNPGPQLSPFLLNSVPFNVPGLTLSVLWEQYWLKKAYTYTIVLDISIMNSSKRMVHFS